MLGNRARITLPDVLFAAFSLAILGALYPVVSESLQINAAQMSVAELYLYQLVLPLALLVFLVGVWRTAVGGAL